MEKEFKIPSNITVIDKEEDYVNIPGYNENIEDTYINEQFKIGQKLTHKKHPEFGNGVVSKINKDIVFIEFKHGRGLFNLKPLIWTTDTDNFEQYNVIYSEKELKKLKNIEVKI